MPIGKGNKLRSELEPVWKSINRANNRQIAKTGKLAYDTLVDVIKDLAAPVLHNPGDGKAITFRNFYEFVDLVHKDKVKPPIVAEGNQRIIWTKLSAIYTANCKGKLTQIEGVLEDYANLSKDKDMIKKELDTALKNQDIDQASKKKTIELVEKYFDKIPGAGPAMVAELERLKKDLSKEPTVSDKSRK